MKQTTVSTLVGAMNPDNSRDLYQLARDLCQPGEIFDTAKPAAWSNQMRDQGINPGMYIWFYDQDTNRYGTPVHLLQFIVERIWKEMTNIDQIAEQFAEVANMTAEYKEYHDQNAVPC